MLTCSVSIPNMAATKRATVYFDPDLHKALRVKAAETDRSLTDLVNDAVREILNEDSEISRPLKHARRSRILRLKMFSRT